MGRYPASILKILKRCFLSKLFDRKTVFELVTPDAAQCHKIVGHPFVHLLVLDTTHASLRDRKSPSGFKLDLVNGHCRNSGASSG